VPCGDQFPECHYIRDGHQDKKKYKKQEETVTKLSLQYSNLEKSFEEYISRKIKENIEKYRKLEKEEAELSNKIDKNSFNKENVVSQISATKLEVKKLKKELQKLQRTVDVLEGKEFERKKETLERIRKTIHVLEDKRQEILKELGGKQEQLKRLLDEEEETKALIEKLKVYDSIVAAFSKTGIPAMVLKSQLPAINQELSKILEGVVEFKVFLETDINSNTMDVFIQDTHSKRIIETASGMEKTIASLALRVALINLSSLPKSDLFIVDEGYGALDPDNMQSAIVFLEGLKGYFKTILTISHIPEIKESADIIIDVENDGGDSKVVYPLENFL
jgi:exonuclease SbcC